MRSPPPQGSAPRPPDPRPDPHATAGRGAGPEFPAGADPSGEALSAPDAAVVERAIAAHAATPGGLLPLFHAIQDAIGWVPRAAMPRIAAALNWSRADVYGVLTFYHDFRTAPPGRRVVKLCRAEACQAAGANALIREVEARCGVALGGTRADGAVTLEPVYCLGNCALSPSALVDGELRGLVTADGLLLELSADVAETRAGGGR